MAVMILAAANITMCIGVAHASEIILLPVNDNGGNHSPVIFSTDAGLWGLSLPDHANVPVDVTPGSSSDSEEPAGPPPAIPFIASLTDLVRWPRASHSGTTLVLPVNDNGGNHSPVITPGDNGTWILTLPGQAHVPPTVTPGSGPSNGNGQPPVIVPEPSGPPSSNAGGGDSDDSSGSDTGFGGGPTIDPPSSVPEPGTLSFLFAGAAFVGLRSLRLKRS